MIESAANDRPMAQTIGLDLVSVADVAAAVSGPDGGRYVARVFTPAEVSDCRRRGRLDPARLAARFAAKEAVLKALDAGDAAIPLRDIELVSDASGAVSIALHRAAARLAKQRGVPRVRVSVSQESAFAAAIVIGEVPDASI